jgi:hypothetical protein
MARVPQALADQALAYAQQHGLDMSTLVRAGLKWVITQPPDRVVPPASPPPSPAPPPEPRPPQLPQRILRVLERHPAGIDVAMTTAQVNADKKFKGHRASQEQVGQCLRHLRRERRVTRLAYGLYTARQQALDTGNPD